MVDTVPYASLYPQSPQYRLTGQKQQYELQLQQLRQQLAQQVAAAKQQAEQQVQMRQSQLGQQLQAAQQQLDAWKAQQQDTLSGQEQDAQQSAWAAQNPNAAQQQVAGAQPQWGNAPDFGAYALTNQRGQAMTFARGGMMPRYAGGGYSVIPGDLGPGGAPPPTRALLNVERLPNGSSIYQYSDGTYEVAAPNGEMYVGYHTTYGNAYAVASGAAPGVRQPAPPMPTEQGLPPSTTYGGAAYPSRPPAPPAAAAAPAPAAGVQPRPSGPPVAPPAPAAPAAPPVTFSGSAVRRPAPLGNPNAATAASQGVFDTTNLPPAPPTAPPSVPPALVEGQPVPASLQAGYDAAVAEHAPQTVAADNERQAAYAAERARNEDALAAQVRSMQSVSPEWNAYFAANPGSAGVLRGWGGAPPAVPATLSSSAVGGATTSSTTPPNGWSQEFWNAVKARQQAAADKPDGYSGRIFAKGGQTLPPMPPAGMMDEMESPDDADAAQEGAEPNAITGEGAGPGGYNMEVVLTPEGLQAAKAVGGIKVVDKPTAASLAPGSIIIPTKENSNLRDVLSKNIPALDGEPAVKDGGEWTPASMARGGKVAAKGKGLPPKVPATLKKG